MNTTWRFLVFFSVFSALACKSGASSRVQDVNEETLNTLTLEKKAGRGIKSLTGQLVNNICVYSTELRQFSGPPAANSVDAKNGGMNLIGEDQDEAFDSYSAPMTQKQVDDILWQTRDQFSFGPLVVSSSEAGAGLSLDDEKPAAAMQEGDKRPELKPITSDRPPVAPPAPGALSQCSEMNSMGCKIDGFKDVQFSMKIAESFQQYSDLFKVGATGKLNYGVVSAEASAAFNKLKSSTSETKYIIIQAKLSGAGTAAKFIPREGRYLKRVFYNLLEKSDGSLARNWNHPEDVEHLNKFYDACGDGFVESFITGSTFLAVGAISIDTAKSTRDFTAKLVATISAFQKLGGANLNANVRAILEELNQANRSDFYISTTGVAPPLQAKTFEEMYKALNIWYRTLEAESKDKKNLLGKAIIYNIGPMGYAGLLVQRKKAETKDLPLFPDLFVNYNNQLRDKLDKAIDNVQRARTNIISLNSFAGGNAEVGRLIESLSAYEERTSEAVRRCLADTYSVDCNNPELVEIPPVIPGSLRARNSATIAAIRSGRKFQIYMTHPKTQKKLFLGLDQSLMKFYFSEEAAVEPSRLFEFDPGRNWLVSGLKGGIVGADEFCLGPGDAYKAGATPKPDQIHLEMSSQCRTTGESEVALLPAGGQTFTVNAAFRDGSGSSRELCLSLDDGASAYLGRSLPIGFQGYFTSECDGSRNQRFLIELK